MTPNVYVNFWKAEGAPDWWVQDATSTVENVMDPQFDFVNLYAQDWSFKAEFSNPNAYSVGQHLVRGFAKHVDYHIDFGPNPRQIHVLVFDSGLATDLPAGQMVGSVGAGNGHGEFGDDGAAGIVNMRSYDSGTIYADRPGSWENNVMHEVFHALTDTQASYYLSPDMYCRDSSSSSADHSLGRIHGGWFQTNSVTPMATWYTVDSANDPPCQSCDGTENTLANATSQSFENCAVNQAEEHISRQF